MEDKYDDALRVTLGIDDDELSSLFGRTFGPRSRNNFQRSFAWQCYRVALPVRDQLYRHGSAVSQASPRCAQSNETALHALVQCLSIAELWVYVEELLSCVGQIWLSA